MAQPKGPKINEQDREDIFEWLLEELNVDDTPRAVWNVLSQSPGYTEIPEIQGLDLAESLAGQERAKVDEVLEQVLADESLTTMDAVIDAFETRVDEAFADGASTEAEEMTFSDIDAASGYTKLIRGVLERKQQALLDSVPEVITYKEPKLREKDPFKLELRAVTGDTVSTFSENLAGRMDNAKGRQHPLHCVTVLRNIRNKGLDKRPAKDMGSPLEQANREEVRSLLQQVVSFLQPLLGETPTRPYLGSAGVSQILYDLQDWPWHEIAYDRQSVYLIEQIQRALVVDMDVHRFPFDTFQIVSAFEGLKRLPHYLVDNRLVEHLHEALKKSKGLNRGEAIIILNAVRGFPTRVLGDDFLRTLRAQLTNTPFNDELFGLAIQVMGTAYPSHSIRSWTGLLMEKKKQMKKLPLGDNLTNCLDAIQNMPENLLQDRSGQSLRSVLFDELEHHPPMLKVWDLPKCIASLSLADEDSVSDDLLRSMERCCQGVPESNFANDATMKAVLATLPALYDLREWKSYNSGHLHRIRKWCFGVLDYVNQTHGRVGKSDKYLVSTVQVCNLLGHPLKTNTQQIQSGHHTAPHIRYAQFQKTHNGKVANPLEQERFETIVESLEGRGKFQFNHNIGSGFECDLYGEVNGVKIDIEIDGVQHSGRVLKDARRDAFLNQKGIRVLRVSYQDDAEAIGLAVDALVSGEMPCLLSTGKTNQLGLDRDAANAWPDLRAVYADPEVPMEEIKTEDSPPVDNRPSELEPAPGQTESESSESSASVFVEEGISTEAKRTMDRYRDVRDVADELALMSLGTDNEFETLYLGGEAEVDPDSPRIQILQKASDFVGSLVNIPEEESDLERVERCEKFTVLADFIYVHFRQLTTGKDRVNALNRTKGSFEKNKNEFRAWFKDYPFYKGGSSIAERGYGEAVSGQKTIVDDSILEMGSQLFEDSWIDALFEEDALAEFGEVVDGSNSKRDILVAYISVILARYWEQRYLASKV